MYESHGIGGEGECSRVQNSYHAKLERTTCAYRIRLSKKVTESTVQCSRPGWRGGISYLAEIIFLPLFSWRTGPWKVPGTMEISDNVLKNHIFFGWYRRPKNILMWRARFWQFPSQWDRIINPELQGSQYDVWMYLYSEGTVFCFPISRALIALYLFFASLWSSTPFLRCAPKRIRQVLPVFEPLIKNTKPMCFSGSILLCTR